MYGFKDRDFLIPIHAGKQRQSADQTAGQIGEEYRVLISA